MNVLPPSPVTSTPPIPHSAVAPGPVVPTVDGPGVQRAQVSGECCQPFQPDARVSHQRPSQPPRSIPGQPELQPEAVDLSTVTPDWTACEAVLRHHAKTFFFGSHFLPTSRRQAIAAAYAYCRIADDIVDCPTAGPNETMRALDAWEAELDYPRHPVALAFAIARARYDVPVQPVRDLLDGMRMDLVSSTYATWDDLRRYCYHAAGTIGLITAPIFGCSDDVALPYAVDLGIAMQLTNVLRDVAEDAGMGRLYLPLDDLVAFGVDPESVLVGRPNGDMRSLMMFEIDRARDIYRSARLGIPALCPSGRLTTLAISNLYSKILNGIEAQNCDPFQGRASVPTHGKIRAMPIITVDFLRLQISGAFRT